MKDVKTAIIEGVTYFLDTTGEDRGNLCLNCVTSLSDQKGLCIELPDCRGGVWKLAEPDK